MLKNKIIIIFLFIFFIKYQTNYCAITQRVLSKETLKAAQQLMRNKDTAKILKDNFYKIKNKIISDPNKMSIIPKKSTTEKIKHWANKSRDISPEGAKKSFQSAKESVKYFLETPMYNKWYNTWIENIKYTLRHFYKSGKTINKAERAQAFNKLKLSFSSFLNNVPSNIRKNLTTIDGAKAFIGTHSGTIIGAMMFVIVTPYLEGYLVETNLINDTKEYLEKISLDKIKEIFYEYIKEMGILRINELVKQRNEIVKKQNKIEQHKEEKDLRLQERMENGSGFLE